VAYNSDGQYAIVTNYFSNNFSLIRVNGASSAVIGTYSSSGQVPLRLAYNPVLDRTGIGDYTSRLLVSVNPRTGAFIRSDSYAAYGEIFQVMLDEAGSAVVLTNAGSQTPAHLHRGAEAVALPATPSYFDYCPAVQKAAVVMPGPDWLTVIDWNASDAPEVTTIPLAPTDRLEAAWPNPASAGTLRIAFDLARPAHARITLLDCSGRRVADLASGEYGSGRHEVLWRARVAPGSYAAVLNVDTTNDVWALRFRDPALAPVDEARDSAVLRVRPNPTRGSLRIEIVSPSRSDFTIGIYDPSGRIVRQLSGMGPAGGIRMLLWDGRDDRGRAVPGGIYFLRACGSGFRESSMLSVVR